MLIFATANRSLPAFQSMHKSLLFVIFLLNALPEMAAGEALVAGTFRNALYGRRLELQVNHRYIDGRISTHTVSLEEGGAFAFHVQVPEAQLVTLTYDDDKLVFFLEPNDTVFIETDVLTFPLVVDFGGRGGHNNRLWRQFLMENPTDFNEFNLLRYKAGQLWLSIPADMDARMQHLAPDLFREYMDKRRLNALTLLDEYSRQHPQVTPAFRDFMGSEILYAWGYNLLFYGTIYKNWNHVEPDFFKFQKEVPASSETIGSHTYRQYLMALMNALALQNSPDENRFVAQYRLATDRLEGKSLAFFRSEIIQNALTTNYIPEILPHYVDFLKKNDHCDFDQKITDAFEKEARYAPGTIAPSIDSKDRDGNQIGLEKLRGRVVLLDFWASWCRPCLQKMDELAPFQADFEANNIAIVHVSLDADNFVWQKTIAERGIRGTHLLSENPDGNIANRYGVKAIPQYFIIGKNGLFAEKPHTAKIEDLRDRLIQLAKQDN